MQTVNEGETAVTTSAAEGPCPPWHHWRPEAGTYRCREDDRLVPRAEWE